MKRPRFAGVAAGSAALAIALTAGLVGMAEPVVSSAASGDFVETFEDPASLDRFEWQIHHSPIVSYTPSSWQGDHDENCGKPGTTRTIRLPEEGRDPGDAAYWCAPGGPGTGHLMTSFRSTGYAQVGFAPKQRFSHVGKVCWDQNQTNLGNRKWTQVVVVPEATYQRNDQRLDYVKRDIEGPNRPGAKGVYMTEGVFLFSMVTGSAAVYTGRSTYDVDFRGFKNSDKARRYTTCIIDLEDGRVRIELERDDVTEVRTLKGALPDGPARVIFQDDTYNSTKAPSSVSNPFTWHWDNILISTDARAKPPTTKIASSLPYAVAERLG